MREIHELAPPAQVWPNQPLAHRASAVARHLAWGTLPGHLIEQIDEYVAPLELGDTRLLHADLTADHLFVADESLIGITDWGDAMAADRHYDLVALHLDAFATDASPLRVFCEAYGWPVDDEFPRRLLGVALPHEFDVLAGLKERFGLGEGLDTVRSLDELATRVLG